MSQCCKDCSVFIFVVKQLSCLVLVCLTTMMKALRSFDMLGTASPVIQHHIPKDLNFQQQRYTLQSHII